MKTHSYPGPETIHRYQLENGIIILVYENFASPSVELEGLVRAGSLAEERTLAGLASFTAAMLLRGTQNRSFEQIYEELESVGAEVGFSAGWHTTGFSGSSLAEDLDLLLSVIGDSLRYPTFPLEHLEKVRGEFLTSFQIQANDTRRQAGKAFRELLYGDHPYALDSQGLPETVARIQQADLVAFHQSCYGTRNLILTVVGAVRADEVVAKVQKVLGDWKHPQQRTMPAVPPAPRPENLIRTHFPMPDKTQSDLVLGLPGPLRSAPDYMDIRLANTILGVFGMYGRLGKNVREAQGLAYYVYSRLPAGLGPAPWIAGTGVSPDKVEQALTSIRHEIRRMQDELVPMEELEDSKAFLTGSLPVSLETNDGLSDIITDMELYGLGLDYLQRYPDQVNEITPERVQMAAQKYLSADQIAVAVAGPSIDG